MTGRKRTMSIGAYCQVFDNGDRAVSPIHDDVIKWKHFQSHRSLWGETTGDPVTGGFPSQRPVTFYVFLDLRLSKRLSKQWRHWWFQAPSRSLWRHCNEMLPRDKLPFDDQRWYWWPNSYSVCPNNAFPTLHTIQSADHVRWKWEYKVIKST